MLHDERRNRCDDCYLDEMHALYRIAGILNGGTGNAEVFEQVLGVIEEELGMARGTVMLLLPDNSELVIQAASSRQEDVRGDIRYRRGEGVIGTVVDTGNPVVVPDIGSEPMFKGRLYRRTDEKGRTVGFICVPVSLENEVIGTFSVDIVQPHRYSLEHAKRTLAIIASMIAGYLRSRRMVRLERQIWQEENTRLRSRHVKSNRPSNMIGASAVMNEVFNRIKILAESDITVLVRGPSGTGKELVASAIHYGSRRAEGPFVKVNCAALSENLIESELFGHEKGAFSGALQTRKGRIEEAEGGTLFLDEFGDISLNMQVKLLRVIQERQFERVGSSRTQEADIRLVIATNRDLEHAVRHGQFREDLYYRINVFPVFLPALAKRKEDIMPLANHFIGHFSRTMGRKVTRISTPAINMMMAYHWPGNVRELENCIEYAVLLSGDGVIYGHNLPPTLQTPDDTNITAIGGLRARVAALERDMIVDALKRTNGNVAAAAETLQITPRMVRYKMQQLGIRPKQLVRPEA